MDTKLQRYELYHFQKIQPVLGELLSVLELANIHKDYYALVGWSVLDYVQRVYDVGKASIESPYFLSPLVEKSISLIELDLIRKFRAKSSELFSRLVSPGGNMPGLDAVSPKLGDLPEHLFSHAGVRLMNQQYTLLAEPDQFECVKILKDLADISASLYDQLNLVSAVFWGNQDARVYGSTELAEMLTKKEIPNPSYLITSLVDAISSKNRVQFTRIILNMFAAEDYILERDVAWDENLLMTVSFHLFFDALPMLSKEEVVIIINNYLYKAVIAGVDVKQAFSQYTADMADAVDYAERMEMIKLCIIKSKESVVVTQGKKMLAEVLEKFIKIIQGAGDVYLIEQSLEELYGTQPMRDFYKDAIRRIVDVLTTIYNGNLIDKSSFRFTDSEIADNEVTKLLAYTIKKENWPKFVEYYLQPDPILKMKLFFKVCSKYFNLDNSDLQEHLLNFSSYLKEKNIIKEDQDLLVFDESVGKFVWNEKLISI